MTMITLKDKLSHLTYRQACKYLGDEGEKLIRQGGKIEIDPSEQIFIGNDIFRLRMENTVVEISLRPDRKDRLAFRCSSCQHMCEHLGAAFSLILEEKMTLGLAAPPPERVPIESLNETELVRKALEERAQRAKDEPMDVRSTNKKELWTDYFVSSRTTGKTYRVALRGWERGEESYCSCPDYRKNTLGTCKHILHVISNVQSRFKAVKKTPPYQLREIIVYLRYGKKLELRMLLPAMLPSSIRKIVAPIEGSPLKIFMIYWSASRLWVISIVTYAFTPTRKNTFSKASTGNACRRRCEISGAIRQTIHSGQPC